MLEPGDVAGNAVEVAVAGEDHRPPFGSAAFADGGGDRPAAVEFDRAGAEMPRLRQAAAGTQQGEFGGKIGQQLFDFGTNHCGLFRVVPFFTVAFRPFQLPLQPG